MLLILMFISLITILAMIFFVKKVASLIYILRNIDEDSAYNKLKVYSICSYIISFIPLVCVLFISKGIHLLSWVYLYYAIWILCILFMKLNFKMIQHYLNVLFVPNELEQISKEFLIGAICNQNGQYVFIYRLTKDIIKL